MRYFRNMKAVFLNNRLELNSTVGSASNMSSEKTLGPGPSNSAQPQRPPLNKPKADARLR